MKTEPSDKNNRLPSIKNWAEDDRPRKKLIEKGKDSLSNTELMSHTYWIRQSRRNRCRLMQEDSGKG